MNHIADRETLRWVGVGAIVFAGLTAAVVLDVPGPLLVAVFAVAVGGLVAASGPPTVTLAVEREVTEQSLGPDQQTTVTVTVTNEGNRAITDLRILDGVPPALTVEAGSPRHATALRVGERTSFQYVLSTRVGVHPFGPTTVLARDVTGAHERTVECTASGTTELAVAPTLDSQVRMPLRTQQTPYAGARTTATGGAGVEFHSTRDYQHGDPLSRIDWNRVARTGELTTVSFRQERAGSVVLVVDTRADSHVGATDSAVARSVEATATAAGSLLDSGDRVGVATFGPGEAWLPPGSGPAHRARLREQFATNPAFAVAPDEDSDFLPWLARRRLRRRLSGGTQLVVFSPLLDSFMLESIRRYEAHGYPVTVVSPDPTGTETPGQTLERIERSLRLSTLRETGVRVIDWGDEPFETALAGASRRWSR
ncbi:MAG: DUF58 domain-containing protein [Halobacteriales archaeon]|nr:DUF58 domain-containing protein [Halobacteriales archaeon]